MYHNTLELFLFNHKHHNNIFFRLGSNGKYPSIYVSIQSKQKGDDSNLNYIALSKLIYVGFVVEV